MKNDDNNDNIENKNNFQKKHSLTLFDDPENKENIYDNFERKKLPENINIRRHTLNTRILNKGKNSKNHKKISLYQKCIHFLFEMFEHIIMQIFIILLSVFSLFHEDIKILSLPKTVDYPFHHVNEFIFFFFLTEFLVFLLSKKHFVGSFYFYLDIVSLISLIPEVHLIWDPILSLIEDDGSS